MTTNLNCHGHANSAKPEDDRRNLIAPRDSPSPSYLCQKNLTAVRYLQVGRTIRRLHHTEENDVKQRSPKIQHFPSYLKKYTAYLGQSIYYQNRLDAHYNFVSVTELI